MNAPSIPEARLHGGERYCCYEHQCHRCGREFASVYPTAKWCSHRCRNDAYMARRNDRRALARHKACEHCGDEFEASRTDARYCDAACKQAAYRLRSVAYSGSGKFAATHKRNKRGLR